MRGILDSPVKSEAILGSPITHTGPPRRHSWVGLTRATRVLSLLRALAVALVVLVVITYCFPTRSIDDRVAMPPVPTVRPSFVPNRRPLYEAPHTHQEASGEQQQDSPAVQQLPNDPTTPKQQAVMKQQSVQDIPDVKQAPPPEHPPVTPIKGEKPAWQDYDFLQRYFGGLRTVSKSSKVQPEYPHGDHRPQIAVDPAHYPDASQDNELPELHADHPFTSEAVTCYLDVDNKVPVPKVRAYSGKVQGFPDPIMGSYEALNIDGNKCYDRHGRFGPYGYGYREGHGGIGAGIHDEREGVDRELPVDYSKVRWGDAQNRCIQKNQHRLDHSVSSSSSRKEHVPRSAVVLRIWHKFEWTQELILHVRSMVSELSLLSGGAYQVYFLIHVKDNKIPIWSSQEVYDQVLNETLPEEFRDMGVLWSEKEMELVYWGLTRTLVLNRGIFGVFRSAHFPLQYFAHKHPEFDYVWNWEIDIRYTGHWYALFDSLVSFAQKQPRKGMWERNERFYIPSVHGTWEDFTNMVANATESQRERPPVWGPHATNETPILPTDPRPPRSYTEDRYEWGVGEEADLITLSPLFDPVNSGWAFRNDVTGYKTTETSPPRRISIVTASRLSRRLLDTMHKETSQFRHTMFDEMWPATMALHHGLKAVYAPHPVFMDRAWPPSAVDATFNSGPNGVSGSSRDSPFFLFNEHNFRGLTWYYNAIFAGRLWRRWWGFSVDGQGGPKEEIAEEGRMCLPPMLLHPIKGFELVIEKK